MNFFPAFISPPGTCHKIAFEKKYCKHCPRRAHARWKQAGEGNKENKSLEQNLWVNDDYSQPTNEEELSQRRKDRKELMKSGITRTVNGL